MGQLIAHHMFIILLDHAKYYINFLGSSMTLAVQVPHDLVEKSAWWCNTDSDCTLPKSLRASFRSCLHP